MSKIVTIKKHQPERLMLSSEMVPVVGLEPTRYRYQRILSSISQKEPLGTEWND